MIARRGHLPPGLAHEFPADGKPQGERHVARYERALQDIVRATEATPERLREIAADALKKGKR